MKYFLITDIHSNLPALETVISDMKSRFPDIDFSKKDAIDHKVICLGDVVGYMPYANECMEKIWDFCDVIVPGNHDIATWEVIHDELYQYYNFNLHAREPLHWTAKQLTKENINLLDNLIERDNRRVIIEDVVMAHGDPTSPDKLEYIYGMRDGYENFFSIDEFKGMKCFVGHSHMPFVCAQLERKIDSMDDIKFIKAEKIDEERNHYDLSKYYMSLCVVPSTGQPRDSDPRTGYAVYDSVTEKFVNFRINYPVQIVQQRMKELRFSIYDINRLENGK